MHFILLVCLGAGLLEGVDVPNGDPVLRMEFETTAPAITHLGWDTEGGPRAALNLLSAPISPALRIGGAWHDAADLAPEVLEHAGHTAAYRLKIGEHSALIWRITQEHGGFSFDFEPEGAAATEVEAVRLDLPFDPGAAATAVIPADWKGENQMRLPAIISAPDQGQMLLSASSGAEITASMLGTRADGHSIKFRMEWPMRNVPLRLEFAPVHAPLPEGLEDATLWRAIRRGWFNLLQPSAQWGEEGRPQYAPPGLLANNVISDPVSCVVHMKGDHVLLEPELGGGISAAPALRNTLDWWLDHGIEENGEMRSWRHNKGMLDANAAPLIAAWCYVEATGDTAWLERRLPLLEQLADYLAGRDTDGDGLVEAVHSGNYGTQIGRFGSSAYDTINSGHKDAYGNALIYRAWRCLADLQRQADRTEQAAHYATLADRLKAVYENTFFNPDSGWLAWWKSEDGELHDLSSHLTTSLAVKYGLVPPERGRAMLNRLWEKIEEVGFDNFEIGVPLTLEPVRQGQYMQPHPDARSRPHGSPEREDGSDTFKMYLNGGCCVSDAFYFITALNIAGEHEKADRIMHAMLKRQVEGVFENGGGFQNGVVDRYPHGAEFMDWEGNTAGYEGHLVYSFSFLQAALLREPEIRARILRPLM